MMNVSWFFTEFSIPQEVSFLPRTTGMWTQGNNRMVSVMVSGPGIVAIGLIFIASLVLAQRCVKRYTEYCKGQKIRQFVDNVAYVWAHRKDPTQKTREIEALFKKEFERSVQILSGGGFSPLKSDAGRVLNLYRLALTDKHLQYMAQLDAFNDVEYLCLSENPLLTGHGVAAIGQQGFSGLQYLRLDNNPRLVEIGFKEWVSCKGFDGLKSLDLCNTGITTDLLEEMIRLSDWVKRLEGLDLRGDNKIDTLPYNNILSLTGLKEHLCYSNREQAPVFRAGLGLLFPKTTRYTERAVRLIFEKKAHGGDSASFLLLDNERFTKMTFEELCAFCKVQL